MQFYFWKRVGENCVDPSDGDWSQSILLSILSRDYQIYTFCESLYTLRKYCFQIISILCTISLVISYVSHLFCAHLCAVPISFNCNDKNRILGKWNHEISDAILWISIWGEQEFQNGSVSIITSVESNAKMISMWFFVWWSFIFLMQHTPVKNYWLCDTCDRDFMLKKISCHQWRQNVVIIKILIKRL